MELQYILTKENVSPFTDSTGMPTGEYDVTVDVDIDEFDSEISSYVKQSPMIMSEILEDMDFHDLLNAIKHHIEPGGVWEYEKLPKLLALLDR